MFLRQPKLTKNFKESQGEFERENINKKQKRRNKQVRPTVRGQVFVNEPNNDDDYDGCDSFDSELQSNENYLESDWLEIEKIMKDEKMIDMTSYRRFDSESEEDEMQEQQR